MQFVYVSCQLLNQFTEFYEMFHEVMKLLNMRFSAIRLLSPPLLAVFFSQMPFICVLSLEWLAEFRNYVREYVILYIHICRQDRERGV